MSQAEYQGKQHCVMTLVFDSFYSTPSIKCFAYGQKGSVSCYSGTLFSPLCVKVMLLTLGKTPRMVTLLFYYPAPPTSPDRQLAKLLSPKSMRKYINSCRTDTTRRRV